MILVNAFASESFDTPPTDRTKGAAAVPPKSPANCTLPFTPVVASTIVPVEVPDPIPVPALLATYFCTAN